MVCIKCPACGKSDFIEDNEDPDYYTCAGCETEIIVNTGGILTQHQRKILENKSK